MLIRPTPYRQTPPINFFVLSGFISALTLTFFLIVFALSFRSAQTLQVQKAPHMPIDALYTTTTQLISDINFNHSGCWKKRPTLRKSRLATRDCRHTPKQRGRLLDKYPHAFHVFQDRSARVIAQNNPNSYNSEIARICLATTVSYPTNNQNPSSRGNTFCYIQKHLFGNGNVSLRQHQLRQK